MIRNYEIMYILKSNLNDVSQKIKSINQILAENKIELIKTDELGLKDFAYKIKNEKNGYYVVTKFLSEPNFLKTFEHFLRFDNDVLRYLITKDHYSGDDIDNENKSNDDKKVEKND